MFYFPFYCQVLSDPELRAKYDVEGKEGLSPDRTDVADGPVQADPAILFAFLFGSDKFNDYLGRLAMATSALVADSSKIGQREARIVQQRRVTRLAIKLAERLQIWVTEDFDGAKAIWESAAEDLSKASYGAELIHLIGKVYSLSAHQFLGATDSGVGMPSIASWAKVNIDVNYNHELPKSNGNANDVLTRFLSFISRGTMPKWKNPLTLRRLNVMDSWQV